jgi:hypothetical protein
MGKFNLTEAAKDILLGEGSKETFDANIASKKGQRGNEGTTGQQQGMVGQDRVQSKTAYGTNDAGEIGQSPERALTDELPDYLKGVPSATPPGATPPVSAEEGGEQGRVGASIPKNQPQSTMGRTDIMNPAKSDATPYENIRDRIAGKLPSNTFGMNHGATFQHYDGTSTAGVQSTGYNEDVEALLQGENLSEEFKQKAATIFEAAVMARVTPIVEEVEAQLMEQFEIAVEEIKEDLAAKVDDYLNYMVEEWMKENEIAIHSGLKAEIVEDFIHGLRDLFVEHYIDIPEDKVDVVEELTTKVEELEASLNEQINKSVDLTKELNEQKKIEAIYTACEGLSQTQVEKLKSLAENVEYNTEEDFAAKLSTLKESYFKSDVKVADKLALDEEVDIEEEKKSFKSSDPSMDLYAKTISQTLVK